MSVRVSWARDSGIPVASLSGRVDSGNSVECADALRSGIGDDDQSLILNLSRLDYISSAGLRVLLMMAKKFTEPGQAFGLCELSGGINEVITVSGFADIIPVYGSQDAAVAAIAGDAAPREPATGAPASGEPTERAIELRNSVDMDVLGENISDIARFTIEKHEFNHPALSAAQREKAYSAITGVLWERVEAVMIRRSQFLAGMFQSAATTLEDVLADG